MDMQISLRTCVIRDDGEISPKNLKDEILSNKINKL